MPVDPRYDRWTNPFFQMFVLAGRAQEDFGLECSPGLNPDWKTYLHATYLHSDAKYDTIAQTISMTCAAFTTVFGISGNTLLIVLVLSDKKVSDKLS